MAHPALDMGKAWTQATGMLGSNRDLVGVLAGLFLFVPLFVAMTALLGAGIDFGTPDSEPDPERVAAQINALLAANWAPLLLAIIGQLAGGIAILALLGDPRRPTVRDVLGRVPRLLLPMLGAQLLVGVLTSCPRSGRPAAGAGGAVAALRRGVRALYPVRLPVSAVVVMNRQPIPSPRCAVVQLTGAMPCAHIFFALLGMVAAIGRSWCWWAGAVGAGRRAAWSQRAFARCCSARSTISTPHRAIPPPAFPAAGSEQPDLCIEWPTRSPRPHT